MAMVLVMVVTVYLHHFYLFSISTADSAATCVSAVLSAARSIPAKSTPSPFTWWNSRSDFWNKWVKLTMRKLMARRKDPASDTDDGT